MLWRNPMIKLLYQHWYFSTFYASYSSEVQVLSIQDSTAAVVIPVVSKFPSYSQNFYQNESYLMCLLLSDESTLHKNGVAIRHNFYYYAAKNPHYMRIKNH